ncbi:MAG: hypothetical protein JXR83_02670 [Deltaproteobacteria bacterium]|nr:hypothetical protein [Deltaproteobacteria bacterium]
MAAFASAATLRAQTDTADPGATDDGAATEIAGEATPVDDTSAAEPQPAAEPAATPPPLTDEQRAYVEQLLDEKLRALPPPQPPEMKLEWKGDTYTKFMFRNNQSNGCVTWGNPHPLGDNFSGENGICSELGLTVNGHVSRAVEVGARLQTRYGQEWADWWENGDRRTVLDTTGESLGMNHAAYLQLRGVYVQVAPPIPTVRFVRIGQSDLSQYNAFTVGKVRYIDRFNAAGVFLNGDLWGYAGYELARVSLPKLWASANWNTGIDDPLIDNPFWTRDAAYVVKLTGSPLDAVDLRFVTSAILDEEADVDDPDALGSTNQIDPKDGVVQTNLRYTNVDSTLEAETTLFDFWHLKAIGGVSYQKPDPGLVFNAVSGNQGLSPVVMKESWGYAAVVRSELFDPLEIGLDLKLEYFNIGEDWTATMGARRESDVLLTDGFVEGGQLPTLNIANEFQDFTEPFYESIIGWHGITALLGYSIWDLTASLEGTYLDYNSDRQDRDVDGVYPDFLFTDGMTDTDYYNFANTNDRGRDPRSVYRRNQARHTVISALKAAYELDLLGGITINGKGKYIWDVDQRDQNLAPDPTADDYTGHLLTGAVGVSGVLTEHLTLGTGYQLDYWIERHRSGDVVAGAADYPDYTTMKHKVHAQISYYLEGLTFAYRIEYLDKNVTTSKPELDYHMRNIVRSVGSVSVSF